MRKEIKTLVYDEELRLEAYRFEGMAKAFPNHFHDYYVIGLIEKGERRLWCRHQEYTIGTGQVLLFNPGDTHACVQADGCALDYRGLNIPKEVMLDLAEEITGNRTLPGFSPAVLRDEDVSCYLRPLHDLVLNGSLEFGKEESLLFMLSLLMRRCGQPFEDCIPECREEIEQACAFMEEHAAERISLDQICRQAGLSKSTLLRAFTKSKGVTPYCYLESLRIGRAKKLLEQGASPMEAALQTGFSDQSHFTNYFTRFIGLTPGAYRDIFLKSSGTGGEGQASP